LICHQAVALAKRGNVERHHNTIHPNFKDTYPLKSTLRSKKVDELKSVLKAQQSLFTKPTAKSKAATEASFRVSHLLAKHKKPFTNGELYKEAMVVAADALFKDLKNKEDITNAIKSVPLGPATVARRVELLSEDVNQQVLKDLSLCECYSLQFDESQDVTDTAQLMVFVRMAFKDSTTKEAFLTLLPLQGRTRGEDIYKEFKRYVHNNSIPIHKLVAITTDGAPAMRGLHSGFVALCRRDTDFPRFLNYHCVIHQQALASKVVDLSHVMTLVVKIVNSIRAKGLQHRLFKSLLDELHASYGDLNLHSSIRWLNHLGFLTDVTAKLNELNYDAVNAFKAKVGVWASQLKNGSLVHFPNLEKMLQNMRNKDAFLPQEFCSQLEKLTSEFNRRFQELNDIQEVQVFDLPIGVDMEIIELQNDIELKARSRDSDFWGLVNTEKFPLLSSCARKVKAYFGSTYLCEMAFSQMKIIKSKNRSCLTNRHLTDCVRLAVSNYEPDYRALADSVQSQPSH
uniref:HAT C-terminal dimerisation domain-containing protein n=1 Tax=Cyprinus carpio TaxID=7962 RepID=A0A8C1R9U2_CYPCA